MYNNISLNDSAVKYRLGLIIEWSLGHVTHAQNLGQTLQKDPSVQTTLIQVPTQANGILQNLPGGYTLGASLRARNLVRAALRNQTLDCLFYHTQVTSLFGLGLMQHIPTVISLDATPIGFKTIRATYGDETSSQVPDRRNFAWYKKKFQSTVLSTDILDRLNFEWYRRVFQRAAALVTMSNWAKESLVQDYGVASDKVTAILPGVDLSQWRPTVKEVEKGDPLRLLFVGGDFARKGGYILLEAFRAGLADRCTLDIVTKDETIRSEGPVRVHRGLTPNSPVLQQLFADADLFVFPTLGDTNAFVVLEAMASGLPVVATNVGAITEEVEDGVTGLLVPMNDPGAIVTAVRSLADDSARRVAMGMAGRGRAERLFSGEHNYNTLADVLKRCVDEQRDR